MMNTMPMDNFEEKEKNKKMKSNLVNATLPKPQKTKHQVRFHTESDSDDGKDSLPQEKDMNKKNEENEKIQKERQELLGQLVVQGGSHTTTTSSSSSYSDSEEDSKTESVKLVEPEEPLQKNPEIQEEEEKEQNLEELEKEKKDLLSAFLVQGGEGDSEDSDSEFSSSNSDSKKSKPEMAKYPEEEFLERNKNVNMNAVMINSGDEVSLSDKEDVLVDKEELNDQQLLEERQKLLGALIVGTGSNNDTDSSSETSSSD